MNILYLGDMAAHCTSRHRALALGRIGHHVVHVDPVACVRWTRLSRILHYRTGYKLINSKVRDYVMSEAANWGREYDIVWVDNGEAVSRQLLGLLKSKYSCLVVNYNCDDPTGGRDGARWLTFRGSLCEYHLAVVVRAESQVEYPIYGAQRVLRVWRSADEVAHAPRLITPEIYKKWSSEVAFVGTWMQERGPFMYELVKAGVPLSIWGDRWYKAKEWAELKKYWRGPALGGDDYAYAIQCAKINLGLLSKGNRDLHTQRTAEIPSLGGFFCAERTVEHCMLYRENTEAVFWSDVPECVAKIKYYINNEGERSTIAKNGNRVYSEGSMRNECVVADVIKSLV
jgi:spore maturation protein CgeB